ncbi:LIC12162 family protein, partial [Alphaproteobacteria bacterium]|nr:LIC12162 family protein [Alphaproteobacteria bacterium]
FDKWESVRIAKLKYDNLITKEIFIPEDHLIAFSGQHFKQGVVHDDEWNYHIFLKIIKEFDIETEIVKSNNTFSLKKDYSISSNHIQINKKKLFKFEGYIKSFLHKIFYNKNNIVMINSGLPRKMQIITQFFLFQLNINIFNYTDYHVGNSPDLHLRNTLSKKINKSSNKFESFIFRNIFYLLPTIYLEDFYRLADFEKNSYLPTSPKSILTSTAHLISDEFKFWCAKKIIKGSKLFILQHGASYGTAKMFSYERHEIKISSKFLTWGWVKNSKTIPFCNIKNIDKKIINNNKGYCLLITFNASKYYVCPDSAISSSDWLKYHSSSCEFYNNLPKKIKSLFYVRLSPNANPWNAQKERWQEVDAKIKFASANKIETHYSDSRLNIIDHDGTPFLELINLNLPVILIQKFEPLDDYAIKYYNLLKSVNIFHTSYEAASEHIVNVWDNINEWWFSKPTQEAVEEFNYFYSRNTKNPVKELIKILNHQ